MTDPLTRPSADATVTSIFAPPYRTLTVGIVAIMTAAAFEGMGVITAMPAAARELDGLPWYGWGLTAFAVASLFAMVVAGEWADRSGPLPPLAAGVGVFGLGLLVAGFASTMPALLAGRALQGLGFGGVIVAMYVVIGKAYPEDMRPRVFTALSGAWVVPGIAGPVVAGVVTDVVGWRWVFLGVLVLLVPISAVLIPRMFALRLPGDPDAVRPAGRKRLAVLAAVGAGLLQYAGQLLDLTGALLAVPAIALLVVSVPRLLPPGAFRLQRGLPTVIMMRGFLAGAFFGAEWFVPLMLVSERDLAYALAGGALSGAAIGWFIGSWYQGRPSTTIPRWRLVQGGTALTATGIGLTGLLLLPGVPWWLVVVTWSIGAFGMGILYGSLGVLMLQLSPPQEQGANSAALQMSDSLGVIFCTGLGGVIFAAGHVAPGQDEAVYGVIFVVMTVIAVFATVVSPRVRSVRPSG